MSESSDKVLTMGVVQVSWLVEAARQARRYFTPPQDDLRDELVFLVTMGGDGMTAEYTGANFRFSDSAIRFLLDAVQQEIAWISPLLSPPGGRNWESWHAWLRITQDQLRTLRDMPSATS